MRTAALVLLALSGCASARIPHALAERTEAYVFEKPIAEVWPSVKGLLSERNFLGQETGTPYHLETALVTPEGRLPSSGDSTTADRAPPSGGGTAGGGRGMGGRRGASRPHDSSGVALVRFVVDGEAVDATHCRVRIVRFDRENRDTPESDGVVDVEMEWDLISRVEPERAASIRSELKLDGR
jgi:hypothetical protein